MVPGVIHVEMIAQAGGLCIMAANPDILPILGAIKNTKFYGKIIPGDRATIKVDVTVRKDYSMVRGTIEVEGRRVSAAEVMLAHQVIPPELRDRMAGRLA